MNSSRRSLIQVAGVKLTGHLSSVDIFPQHGLTLCLTRKEALDWNEIILIRLRWFGRRTRGHGVMRSGTVPALNSDFLCFQWWWYHQQKGSPINTTLMEMNKVYEIWNQHCFSLFSLLPFLCFTFSLPLWLPLPLALSWVSAREWLLWERGELSQVRLREEPSGRWREWEGEKEEMEGNGSEWWEKNGQGLLYVDWQGTVR